MAFLEELTWILVNNVLVCIVVEHRILLKLTLIYLFFLQSLIHLKRRTQILFAFTQCTAVLFLHIWATNLWHDPSLLSLSHFILLKSHKVLWMIPVFHLCLKCLFLCLRNLNVLAAMPLLTFVKLCWFDA